MKKMLIFFVSMFLWFSQTVHADSQFVGEYRNLSIENKWVTFGLSEMLPSGRVMVIGVIDGGSAIDYFYQIFNIERNINFTNQSTKNHFSRKISQYRCATKE